MIGTGCGNEHLTASWSVMGRGALLMQQITDIPVKFPSSPVDIISAVMIFWRIRENYENCSVLCCV